jgi:hypothetical protein
MAEQDDSLSVLKSVASGQSQNAAPAQSAPQQPSEGQPQDSMAVLQQIGPVTMVGPNGEKKQVPREQVTEMRKQQFSVDPSTPDARPMLEPNSREGTLFYALPEEVEPLAKAGNHAIPTAEEQKILDADMAKGKAEQGTFSKLLGLRPDGGDPRAKAIRDKYDSLYGTTVGYSPYVQEQFKDKATGGAIVVGAPAAIASVNAAPVAVDAGLNYLGRAALPGLEREAGKYIVKQVAKSAAKKAAVAGAGYAGVQVVKHTGLIDKLLELF